MGCFWLFKTKNKRKLKIKNWCDETYCHFIQHIPLCQSLALKLLQCNQTVNCSQLEIWVHYACCREHSPEAVFCSRIQIKMRHRTTSSYKLISLLLHAISPSKSGSHWRDARLYTMFHIYSRTPQTLKQTLVHKKRLKVSCEFVIERGHVEKLSYYCYSISNRGERKSTFESNITFQGHFFSWQLSESDMPCFCWHRTLLMLPAYMKKG